MKFSVASIYAAASLMMVGSVASANNLDMLKEEIMKIAQENVQELQSVGSLAAGSASSIDGTGAVGDMIKQIINNLDERTVAGLVNDSLPKNALGGGGRRDLQADGEFCFFDDSSSPSVGKKGSNGAKKGGAGGKKGAMLAEPAGFSLFIQFGVDDAISRWEGDGTFAGAAPGESAQVGDIMFGLQITFDSDIEPFVPFETDFVDFFTELFLSISQVDFTIGVLSGTATKNRRLLLDSAYLNYGLDYLVIPIFGDCDPP
ncbi:MAG: hypothetical protein SGARI_005868, partial [Bacillariaceae sp.]